MLPILFCLSLLSFNSMDTKFLVAYTSLGTSRVRPTSIIIIEGQKVLLHQSFWPEQDVIISFNSSDNSHYLINSLLKINQSRNINFPSFNMGASAIIIINQNSGLINQVAVDAEINTIYSQMLIKILSNAEDSMGIEMENVELLFNLINPYYYSIEDDYILFNNYEALVYLRDVLGIQANNAPASVYLNRRYLTFNPVPTEIFLNARTNDINYHLFFDPHRVLWELPIISCAFPLLPGFTPKLENISALKYMYKYGSAEQRNIIKIRTSGVFINDDIDKTTKNTPLTKDQQYLLKLYSEIDKMTGAPPI